MSTILESTIALAKRFGVDYEEQTIKDTLDAIIQKLDDTYPGSVDISEAVKEFSKNDGPDARLGTKLITENNTYVALDDELDGYSSVTVEVPSGGETFDVGMEINKSSDTYTVSSNKTLSETLSALSEGKNVVITASVTDETTGTFTSVCCGQVNTQGIDGIVAILYTQDASNAFILTWAGDSGTAINVDPTTSLLILPQM